MDSVLAARLNVDFRILDMHDKTPLWDDIRVLLADSGLGIEGDISTFVTAWVEDRLIACAGLAANVIKCVAISDRWRGENLSAQLLLEVENLALSRGYFHLFLYTRPCNRERFQHSGFWPVVQSGENVILMENIPDGIQRYCRSLQAMRKPGKRIGAIVMNANPFTLGHRYLAEQAARACDWLHLFVVREDVSRFPFALRLKMVQEGVADLPNVTVHQGSPYMISRATFPAYFLKETESVQQAWSEIDLLLFRRFIAPALGITHRFVGSEPFCAITRQYNQAMHQLLAGSVEVVEIERLQVSGRAVSASEVRRLLNEGQFSCIEKKVPETTFRLLVSPRCMDVA